MTEHEDESGPRIFFCGVVITAAILGPIGFWWHEVSSAEKMTFVRCVGSGEEFPCSSSVPMPQRYVFSPELLDELAQRCTGRNVAELCGESR